MDINVTLLAVVGFVCVIAGKLPGSRIIFVNDGFFYHTHTSRENSPFIQLRCTKGSGRNKCRGRAVITKNGLSYWITRHHTHAPDPFYPLELELRRRVYARLHEGDATPFRNIIRQEGQRGMFPVEVRSRFTGHRIRTAMYNVRAQHLPRIPFSLPLLGHYLSLPQFAGVCETLDRRDNIFAGWCGTWSEGTVSVVFASKRLMQLLQQHKNVYADGTFRKRPKKPKCSQLFCISITWVNRCTNRKHALTLIRVFMQKRTQAAYLVLFQFLKYLMPHWNPEQIMCDHEEAQVNAWMISFPFARVATCLWHYAVCVYRHAKDLGLHEMMMDWVFHSIVCCLTALPLLPNYLLYEGLLQVSNWARDSGFMHWPRVRDLFSYIETEWMRRYHYLSVCGSEDRTNNVSECANAILDWDLQQDRPNVYVTIRAFVIQEDQFIVDLHALIDGRPASRIQSLQCLANDERIINQTENLLRGQISVLQFLLTTSRALNAPYFHVFR